MTDRKYENPRSAVLSTTLTEKSIFASILNCKMELENSHTLPIYISKSNIYKQLYREELHATSIK